VEKFDRLGTGVYSGLDSLTAALKKFIEK
jgi:hypothetical protein